MNSDCIYDKRPLGQKNNIYFFSENDKYIDNYEKISEDHLKEFFKTGHNPFMDENHWQEVEESTKVLLEKYSKSEQKVLDVGVGMGRLLESFTNLDRYGIDISDGYLLEAKRKNINVCKSLIEDIPYKKEFFDIVATTDVLEHVLDLNLALKKIIHVLKKEGILIIRVPYKEDLSGYLQDGFPYELVHLRNFDENSLIMLVEKIFNQKVLEITYSGYIGGKFKFQNRFFSFFFNSLLKLLFKINKNLHKKFSMFLKQPAEINIVVKKVNYE